MCEAMPYLDLAGHDDVEVMYDLRVAHYLDLGEDEGGGGARVINNMVCVVRTCVSVCLFVFVYLLVCVCVFVCLFVCVSVCVVLVCACVGMYVCAHISMRVCACMRVCV